MITVVVVIHLIIAISMIGLILLQKSEGNSAGAGFSGSANLSSMMQPRARPNPLSRATVVLGMAFFITSIGLALLSKQTAPPTSLLAPDAAPTASSGPAPKVSDLRPADAAAPAAATPAAPAGSAPAPAATPAAPAGPPAAPQVPNN